MFCYFIQPRPRANNRNSPTKLGLSGKNSARTGRTQPCFLMIGLTRDATRCNIARAQSAFGRSFRCAKDFTNVSGMASMVMVVVVVVGRVAHTYAFILTRAALSNSAALRWVSITKVYIRSLPGLHYFTGYCPNNNDSDWEAHTGSKKYINKECGLAILQPYIE